VVSTLFCMLFLTDTFRPSPGSCTPAALALSYPHSWCGSVRNIRATTHTLTWRGHGACGGVHKCDDVRARLRRLSRHVPLGLMRDFIAHRAVGIVGAYSVPSVCVVTAWRHPVVSFSGGMPCLQTGGAASSSASSGASWLGTARSGASDPIAIDSGRTTPRVCVLCALRAAASN